MIRWDEFMPTAALGALTLICAPLLVVGIPLYLIGRVSARWLESLSP